MRPNLSDLRAILEAEGCTPEAVEYALAVAAKVSRAKPAPVMCEPDQDDWSRQLRSTRACAATKL